MIILREAVVSLTRTTQRLRVEVRGTVQGVGFRPFVYQLARRAGLMGWVRNTSGSVDIEVEGEEAALELFLDRLKSRAPPMARIDDIRTSRHPAVDYQDFEIKTSRAQKGKYQLISPDIATCRDCLKETLDPADRRYRYPFTNCTNCGPRFTIIKDIPYDRRQTTMHRFRMCPRCQKEYDDPLNRRFHAQPNACPQCGPGLELVDRQGKILAKDDPLAAASHLLREGNILAVKGLGGFLLACDAGSSRAVMQLRQRKRRPAKPLAVMFATIEEAERHCYISPDEKKLLQSAPSPIVLLGWRDSSDLSPLVAPGLKYLGVMLAYTPLHHLLLRETRLPLVMTSGNLSEEPIARDNHEAQQRLAGIADYFLMHNRDIHARYDDSVAMVATGATRIIRRARGYAPHPIRLPFKARQILACGAELKNTFCLTRDEYAFLSQHIADLENLESLEHFQATIKLYQKLFRIEPRIIAHDLHPDYLSTQYATDLAQADPRLRPYPVQHHHAHIASCLAENGTQQPAIGVAFDGTGYGSDGHIWGGEFLLADYKGFKRLGHLEYAPLPGGEAAIKKPYRMAISYLYSLLGEDSLDGSLPGLRGIDELELGLIKKQLERKINSPLTSSCGRLFDAVSALAGIRGSIAYEAQAAIELEMAATGAADDSSSYPFEVIMISDMRLVRLKDTFQAIIADLNTGTTRPEIALKFHNTVAQMAADVCRPIARETGVSTVALSGGVFQNRLLLRLTTEALEKENLKVISHRQVPANDGGISLGQAAIAGFAQD
jgi:hydrogenase maturation protein HypF